MASFNKITICGYLGRDPELKYTPQGKAVCNFSIATTEKRKDASGEAQDQTTWFRVTCWERTAEACNQYLSKGAQVFVEGRLRLEEYTDRDGNKRSNLEVNATDIQFLNTKREGGEAATSSTSTTRERANAAAVSAQAPTGRSQNAESDRIDESEIPF